MLANANLLAADLQQANVSFDNLWGKAGLTLNEFYDTNCMTHNHTSTQSFSNFYCVCTIIQVVHT